MARPLRVEYPGAFYHVINRGKSGGRSGGRSLLYRGRSGGRSLLYKFLFFRQDKPSSGQSQREHLFRTFLIFFLADLGSNLCRFGVTDLGSNLDYYNKA
jgi:hypothetical protein